MADRVGQEIGSYKLTRLLGKGGFGEVYEAEHQLLQQKRAIRLLLESRFDDAKHRERFLREARTLAALEHPNIIQVLEMAQTGKLFYLVLPFYSRGTLDDLLKRRRAPLALEEVQSYLEQICASLVYAHSHNVVHLDLKPANMLIQKDGQLVLADFGLAHLLKGERPDAGTSADWGTPYYMAPEHIVGKPERRSDLYALGIILYELLSGQRPFSGDAAGAIMLKQLNEPPPLLRSARPDASAALEEMVNKALAKKPEDRYQSAAELLAAFQMAVSRKTKTKEQWLREGFAAYQSGDYQRALSAYYEATKLDEHNAAIWRRKGDVLRSLVQYEAAASTYERALRLDPQDAVAATGYLYVLLRLKRYKEALKLCGQFLRQNPDDLLLAVERAMAFDPQDMMAYLCQIILLSLLEEDSDGIETAFKKILRLNAHDLLTFLGRAFALVALDEEEEEETYQEIAATFDQAVHSTSGDVLAFLGKALALAGLKKEDEALATLDAAFAQHPDDLFLLLGKVLLFALLEREDEALAAFNQASTLHPSDPLPPLMKAIFLLGSDRENEALAAADLGVQRDPEFALGHLLRAFALIELSRPEEARAAIERVSQLDANVAQVWLHFSTTEEVFERPSQPDTDTDKVLCPYCFEKFHPSECSIFSEKDGTVMVPTRREKLARKFAGQQLGGDKFDKRLRLQCPNCAHPWPEGIELADNLIIAVIGGTGAGIHTFLAMVIDQLTTNARVQQAIGVSRIGALSQYVEARFKASYGSLMRDHKVLPAWQPAAHRGGGMFEPLIYRLDFPPSAGERKPVYLYFYDVANEDIQDESNALEYSQFLFFANAIILLADPFAMPNMRKYIHPQFHPPALPDIRPSDILYRIVHLYETRLRARLNIPIAIAISKSDHLQFADPNRNSSIFAVPAYSNPESSGPLQRKDLEQVREDVRKLLQTYGDVTLVTWTEQYEQVGFFAVAATGWPPDFATGTYPALEPLRVLDPVLWALWKLGVIAAEEDKQGQK